ncbi:hypothetical protein [Bartonella sp. MM73XJBT]|nr:hypothetical protein [Bartonella sp. MM73XJBT]
MIVTRTAEIFINALLLSVWFRKLFLSTVVLPDDKMQSALSDS